MNLQTRIYIPCYFGFLSSGFSVLLLGAIIPYLISDYGISYTVAGSFVSCYSLGTLAASFFTPYSASKIGQKTTIVLLSALVPLGFSLMLFTSQPVIIAAGLIGAGIGRGAIANINNYVVNEYSSGKAGSMNLLHSFFAVGAFCGPLVTSAYIFFGGVWKYAVITYLVLGVGSIVCYAAMPLKNEKPQLNAKKTNTQAGTKSYLRNVDFYIGCALMFFYVGLEYSVNGWFITYFRQTGLMSKAYAANLISILWVVIIFGRLSNAAISKVINKKMQILINVAGCAAFLLLIFSSTDLVKITVSIIGMGFFMAGIYPTCIANTGLLIKGSAGGMALLLAIAGIGGIIIPQVIGALADKIGLVGAMSFLIFDIGLLVIFSVVNLLRRPPAVR